MSLEEEVRDLLSSNLELTPQMVELGMKHMENPESLRGDSGIPAEDMLAFLFSWLSALNTAVLRLAQVLDERL